jgi:molybdopterin converting factor small subunit
MATLRLFATIRVAAGTGRDAVPGSTVSEVVANAVERYGEAFAELVPICRVWVNGEVASDDTAVSDTDEVALLPPVSGG